ncbi:MAG: anhydro-N-acetylmuramic acid kinase [Mariprofundaceae bacterium]|nr:anhydro-N-acetylmuramic acid kinase [Mariprofundaceae bacterium]
MNKQPLFIGIMSGTSCDGIDVAIVRFGIKPRMGEKPELVHFSEHAMPAELHEPLLRLAAPGINEIDTMGELDGLLGQAFAEAALKAISAAGLQAPDIAAIACHGQTIRHRPRAKQPFTLQIGSAAVIAEKTGITTISDFRSRDMAAGGEGAPLVPFAHRQLFASDTQNTAVLNIGGIANITWLGKGGETTGFDCGPGNMLMDALMLEISDGRNGFDNDGELAASGKICAALLQTLMQHPFLQRRPPKSTGREEFGKDIVQRILAWPELSDADRMATSAAFSVRCIADAGKFFAGEVQRWLICGGGARNKHLLASIKSQLIPASVATTDETGMPTQAVEAVSFAILAHQTLCGQNNTLSAVTGAHHDVCGGCITPGDNWPMLLQHMPTWIR